MALRKFVAYAVQEPDENTGGIVFARGPAHARKLGSSQFGTGEDDWGEATRAPWADEYFCKDVPASAMVDAGWYLECHGCGQRIAEGEEDDDGKEIAFDIVGNQNRAFCTPACCNKSTLSQMDREQIEKAAIQDMCKRLLEKLPGAWLWDKQHAYVTHEGVIQQIRVGFRFPGCTIGTAHFGFDKAGEEPTVSVCSGDMPAWEAWRKQHIPPHPNAVPPPQYGVSKS